MAQPTSVEEYLRSLAGPGGASKTTMTAARAANEHTSRAPSSGGTPDPMAVLQSMGISPSGGLDIQASIDAQFNPQYQAVQAAEQQLRDSAARGNTEIGNMYAALQKDIRGQRGNISGNYDQALAAVASAMQGAKSDIGENFDESAAKQAALRQRLGLGQEGAVSAAAQQAAEQRSFLQSLMDASQAGYSGSLNTSKAGALTFNDQQANIAGFTGKNKQADLQQLLQQGLNDLMLKRLGIDSDRASTRADLEFRQQQEENDMQQFLMDYMQKNQDIANQAAMEQQAAEFEQMSPYERTMNSAISAAGGNEGLAQRAMDLIRGVSMNRGMGNNMSDFLAFVAQKNGADGRPGRGFLPSALLSNIASAYYQNVDPRAPISYRNSSGNTAFTGGGY